MKTRTRFFEGRRRAFLFLTFLLVAVFGVLYLYGSEAFRSPPRMEVQAENRFEKTLHVVADKDYAPYSYLGEDGSYMGRDVELMNELANRLQMNLELELMDWPTANRTFLAGDADIIMNIDSDLIVNDHRMIATLPIAEKQYVVYGRRKISNVADLYGRRVASRHQLPGLGLDDEITYLDFYEDIFTALKKGEYEYAICPIQVGTFFLEKLKMDDVVPSYAVMHAYSSMALAPKDTVLCVRLSAMLKQMQEEGRLAELDRKWISHRYENTTIKGMIENHPWLGASLLAILLVMLILVVATVFQYRDFKAQEAYTQHLRENLATIENQREQLKQQQTELLEAKMKAEQGSRAKTTFLFNMSHDIRTPMNAIIGYIELAKRETDLPENMQRFLHKIEASSHHLLALINDILEMSRIESGKLELDIAPTDLQRTMENVHDMFSAQMATKGIRYTVDILDIKNRRVLCDENRLNRVLLNLISNAYKFTPKDGSVSVSLCELPDAPEGHGSYELRVKDSGIGMSEEFAAKVFNAFERERTSTVSGIQGTGLGMAITKSIVDLMHGSIKVATAQGQGTEFIVRLQFPLAENPEHTNEEKTTELLSKETDFTKSKLLLVDDIDVNREIAKMLLEAAGFHVDTAENGKEALEKIAASRPGDYDAVLMDIQMPVMDGYAATQAIRALPDQALAHIPILAMTANAFSEDVETAKAAGMDGHIAKPLDVPKMMETLAEVLSKRNV